MRQDGTVDETAVADYLQSFVEFPPIQKAASFTIDQALEKLAATLTNGH
jgi:arylsulfatase